GFLQTPPWAAAAVGRLLTFVGERYAVHVQIELDVDDSREETSTYWWAAQSKELIEIASAYRDDGEAGNSNDEAVVTEQMNLRLSTEQNMFIWALAQCRTALNARNNTGTSSPVGLIHRQAEAWPPLNRSGDRMASGASSTERSSITDEQVLQISEWNLTTSS